MNDNLIFDSHAHYDDTAFDEDRDVLLTGLKEAGIGNVVDISANLNDLPRILELTKKYDFIYASAGVHPCDVYDLEEADFAKIEEALDDPKAAAVGEIGLDYHYEDTDKAKQKEWFIRQIDLAKRKGYPLVIHSRDAAQDTFDIMKAEKAEDAGGVIHCFSYEKEMAKRYLDLGYYIGVGGVLTYKNARKLVEVVEYMPMERMLLETDCPYLCPVPFRGKRNDSRMLKYVVSRVSEIKNIPAEEVIRVTADNARKMYRLN